MSENQYIKKRQRIRSKPLLTTRNILTLVFLSLAIYAGFYFEFGVIDDGTCEGVCENAHSIWAWVIGFAMMFGIIIVAGAIVGGLLAVLRWSRTRKGDTLSTLLDQDNE